VTLTTLNRFGSPRAADHNGAITSLDAARVAMASVGRDPLSANQFVAADVTGNGTLSALDASYVARFSVALVHHFPVAVTTGSDWKFLKCDPYGPPEAPGCGAPVYGLTLSGAESGKNFHALLYGDVTGDWAPAGSQLLMGGGTSAEELAAVARDRELASRLKQHGFPLSAERPAGMGPAVLSLGGWKPLRAGERLVLTVDLRNAEGILGLDLALRYDPSRLSIVGVEPAGIGSDLNLARSDEAGEYRIAAYGLTPLSGSGAVLTVTVEALRNTGSGDAPSIGGMANEGSIPLTTNGRNGGPRKGR